MNNRYTSIYRLPAELYAGGCPVVVAAGALLRDELNDRYVAQLKLRNIAPATLCSVTVEVSPRDAAGRPVGAPVLHTYTDLNAARDAVFADRTALPLTDRESRIRLPDRVPAAFSVRVTEAVFRDGRLWQGREWPESLPPLLTLENAFGNAETARQYRLRFSEKSKYLPLRAKDLWLCSCGAVEHEDETVCHCCGQSRDGQLQLDRAELEAARDSRLALEQQRREELAELQEKTLLQTTEKVKRIRRRVLLIVVLLAAVAVGVQAGRTWLVPALKYRKGEQLLAKYDYAGAEEIFNSLGDFRDSVQRAGDAQSKGELSRKAAELLKQQSYEEAYALLEQIGETLTVTESRLARAQEALDNGDEAAARELLDGLDDERAQKMLEAIGTPAGEDADESAETEASAAQTAEPPVDTVALSAAKPGDVVVFGTFDMDGDPATAEEDILWIVLERDYDELLLISRQALTTRPYNDSLAAVTWGRSSLRKWLNDGFISAAFSGEEKKLLRNRLKTDGEVSVDRVYLLSAEELEQYDTSVTVCAPGPRAEAEGCRVLNDACYWWLRGRGLTNDMALYVSDSGYLYPVGAKVTFDKAAVRPVIRVKIS